MNPDDLERELSPADVAAEQGLALRMIENRTK